MTGAQARRSETIPSRPGTYTVEGRPAPAIARQVGDWSHDGVSLFEQLLFPERKGATAVATLLNPYKDYLKSGGTMVVARFCAVVLRFKGVFTW